MCSRNLHLLKNIKFGEMLTLRFVARVLICTQMIHQLGMYVLTFTIIVEYTHNLTANTTKRKYIESPRKCSTGLIWNQMNNRW